MGVHCIDETWGVYLVIIENYVSSGLNDMVIPPVQSKSCMKVLRTVPGPSTIFRMENISHNFFRLARVRKQMGDVEQKRQVLGMLLLLLVLSHVKLVSTLTEAKPMTLISA